MFVGNFEDLDSSYPLSISFDKDIPHASKRVRHSGSYRGDGPSSGVLVRETDSSCVDKGRSMILSSDKSDSNPQFT